MIGKTDKKPTLESKNSDIPAEDAAKAWGLLWASPHYFDIFDFFLVEIGKIGKICYKNVQVEELQKAGEFVSLDSLATAATARRFSSLQRESSQAFEEPLKVLFSLRLSIT